jgi:cytoplasmic tRNA 2-thiolation protein 1
MTPSVCAICQATRALIVRPKNHQKLCKPCFITLFETEIHNTIISNSLFFPGEQIAIGASGGKDSTVLASVMKTLNERYDYQLNLLLLSIDEGIKGYRDDSLETVRRNAIQYDLPLVVVGYDELYGWTMDQVVEQIGKKGNCTYCGVFRRQALDRGAGRLGIKHVVTGHNADDIAETVMMNLLRGDLPRMARATSIVTASAVSDIKRSKPLKYAYEKEIVLYAHHKGLDYFSTECIYSPEAFRGSARTLIKNLERVRPSAILDVVRSGEDMAQLVPEEVTGGRQGAGCASDAGKSISAVEADADSAGGCGNSNGRTSGSEMVEMEKKLQADESASGLETEITVKGQNHCRKGAVISRNARKLPRQKMGKCLQCGYLSSQDMCKACVLLEGLNKNRPKMDIRIGEEEEEEGSGMTLAKGLETLSVTPEIKT